MLKNKLWKHKNCHSTQNIPKKAENKQGRLQN